MTSPHGGPSDDTSTVPKRFLVPELFVVLNVGLKLAQINRLMNKPTHVEKSFGGVL